jgi:hypothetical protein
MYSRVFSDLSIARQVIFQRTASYRERMQLTLYRLQVRCVTPMFCKTDFADDAAAKYGFMTGSLGFCGV